MFFGKRDNLVGVGKIIAVLSGMDRAKLHRTAGGQAVKMFDQQTAMRNEILRRYGGADFKIFRIGLTERGHFLIHKQKSSY